MGSLLAGRRISRSLSPKERAASYQRARGYIAKPRSQAIATEELIPLPALVAIAAAADRSRGDVLQPIGAPGTLSRRHGQAEISHVARCAGPASALRDQRSFASMPANSPASRHFEEQFREYAAKDSGTSAELKPRSLTTAKRRFTRALETFSQPALTIRYVRACRKQSETAEAESKFMPSSGRMRAK